MLEPSKNNSLPKKVQELNSIWFQYNFYLLFQDYVFQKKSICWTHNFNDF